MGLGLGLGFGLGLGLGLGVGLELGLPRRDTRQRGFRRCEVEHVLEVRRREHVLAARVAARLRGALAPERFRRSRPRSRLHPARLLRCRLFRRRRLRCRRLRCRRLRCWLLRCWLLWRRRLRRLLCWLLARGALSLALCPPAVIVGREVKDVLLGSAGAFAAPLGGRLGRGLPGRRRCCRLRGLAA